MSYLIETAERRLADARADARHAQRVAIAAWGSPDHARLAGLAAEAETVLQRARDAVTAAERASKEDAMNRYLVTTTEGHAEVIDAATPAGAVDALLDLIYEAEIKPRTAELPDRFIVRAAQVEDLAGAAAVQRAVVRRNAQGRYTTDL